MNPRSLSAKYCLRALRILSAICLVEFSECSSIESAAENQGMRTRPLMSNTEPGQDKSSNQPVSPEPDYEWWY